MGPGSTEVNVTVAVDGAVARLADGCSAVAAAAASVADTFDGPGLVTVTVCPVEHLDPQQTPATTAAQLANVTAAAQRCNRGMHDDGTRWLVGAAPVASTATVAVALNPNMAGTPLRALAASGQAAIAAYHEMDDATRARWATQRWAVKVADDLDDVAWAVLRLTCGAVVLEDGTGGAGRGEIIACAVW